MSKQNGSQHDEEERLAESVYDRLVAPAVAPEDANEFVAIAYEVEDFEIDRSDFAAISRLHERHPGAKTWLMRVGKLPAYLVRRGPQVA